MHGTIMTSDPEKKPKLNGGFLLKVVQDCIYVDYIFCTKGVKMTNLN